MLEILVSGIVYTIFALISIFAFRRIEFTKKFFNNPNIVITLSLSYLVIGFFLSKLDSGGDIFFDIGFAIGHFGICFIGAVLGTFLAMKFRFSFKNEIFYYALSGSMIFGTILFIFFI